MNSEAPKHEVLTPSYISESGRFVVSKEPTRRGGGYQVWYVGKDGQQFGMPPRTANGIRFGTLSSRMAWKLVRDARAFADAAEEAGLARDIDLMLNTRYSELRPAYKRTVEQFLSDYAAKLGAE